MNEEFVKNLLLVVKRSNDKNAIIKALVKLRTDVVKDREGIILFRDCDGIPATVRLLHRPYEKILEVTLSILGNCCTDQICCKEAIENKIIPPLLIILKSLPNPLIQCRSCRLLGNLAKNNKSHLLNHSITISQSLCMIIEETTDIQTTLMAIRAAKFLLTDKFFSKHFILGSGVKILVLMLIKFLKNPKPYNDVDNENSTRMNENKNDQSIGLKSSEHREKYFEEVARNLEGVRSDIFDSQILKKSKRRKNKEFQMPEDKSIIDIISEILKCILVVSEHYSNPMVLKLYEHYNRPGINLASVVFFIEENHIAYRSIALQILSNVANNSRALAALCSSDAISAVCEILATENLNPPLSETECRNCINIMCMLAGDACSRAKIRMNGALKSLVNRAKVTELPVEITMILYALNNFQYDNVSVDLLLREGIVSCLIKELDKYLNPKDKYRKEIYKQKRRMYIVNREDYVYVPPKDNKNSKLWTKIRDTFEPDSPESTDSPLYASSPSPCSSRSMSPINTFSKTLNDENESDSYSPVCSGDESDSIDDSIVENKDKPNEDIDVMKLLEDMENVTAIEERRLSDKDEDTGITKNTTSYKLIASMDTLINPLNLIDNLLLRISVYVNNKGELSKPETLKTIIRAIKAFGITETYYGNTLYNILVESQFFVQILKHDIIHRIYLLSETQDVKSSRINFLEALTSVGESGYGRGELTRFLLKSELDMQKRAAIAVSFIIRTPKILYQFLTENGAIYILMNTILCKGDEHCYEAVDGITSLSKLLGIEIPECDRSVFNEEQEFDESNMNFSNMTTNSTTIKLKNDQNDNNNGNDDDDDDEMKFILHRGCSKIPIKFKKHLLTECSEVFNSMLNSDFRECNEGEIHLKDYSVHGIKYFLNLIYLKSLNELPNIPPIYYYDSLLEAYELSRMYMMVELEMKLFNIILYRLCTKTCLKTLEWSIKNFNPELSEIVINYYLSSDIKSKDKVELYREADYCEHSKEWYQMMIDAILVKCQNLCVDG